MYSYAKVSAPATIANFGPGFDIFGLCLSQPRDVLEVEVGDYPETRIEVESKHPIPVDPLRNIASFSAMRFLKSKGIPEKGGRFRMRLLKGIRPGSGLGSSGASSAAGAYSMSRIFDVDDVEAVVHAAAEGEGLIAGYPHYDNVAACIRGGFTIVRRERPLDIVRIEPPPMEIMIVLPDLVVETQQSRAVLPKRFPLDAIKKNVANASALIYAMREGDVASIGKCLEDSIAIPHRIPLVPGYEDARESALAAGALGFSMCGSGPAVFALCQGNSRRIGEAVSKAFREKGLPSEIIITEPGRGILLEDIR